MNIAIDIQAIATPSRIRGMGVYSLNLIREIFAQDKENQYFLFNCYDECVFEKEKLPSNVYYCSFYSGEDNYLLAHKTAWDNGYNEIWKSVIKTFIKKNKIDTFLISSAFDELMCYCTEWFEGVNLVVIMYDLIPYIFSKEYLSEPALKKWYMHTIEFIKHADLLLAISDSVKDDLVQHLNIPENKIQTIYSGIGSDFCKKEITEKQKKDFLNRYGIRQKFIVFPGGADFRKNVPGTLRAYAKLPEALKKKYLFVVTGITSEEYKKMLLEISKEENIENRILVCNHVPIDDLVTFYNLADLLVFTSQYEGFGLPVAEAFKCGTPVLTSRNSSLGEIAKDAALLVDPFDIDDITNGMIAALTQTDHSRFIGEIKRKLALYQWKNVAAKALEAVRTLPLKETKKTIANKKIAFFTPLNPINSGISDYSEDIIKELSRHCDIDVFIDDGYESSAVFPPNVAVYNHQSFLQKANTYAEVVYQMGNSPYHLYMFPYMKKHAGIAVVHDVNYHIALYSCVKSGQLSVDDFRQYMQLELENIDEYVNAVFENRVTPEMLYSIEANRFIADPAKKIIVHSDYAKNRLLKKNIGYPIKKIDIYAEILDRQNKKSLREKYGIPEDELVLASFGHATKAKRIIQVLKAFAHLEIQDEKIKYYIVGFLHEDIKEEAMQIIRENGLADKVVIKGFVGLEEFVDFIQISDICVNLRYPYHGETSASFMRLLGAGKPVIVTDIGAFSEVYDDCCIKIGHLDEENEIKENIQNLVEHPDLRKQIGQNALQYAKEKLDIQKIAEEYYNYLFEEDVETIGEQLLFKIYMNDLVPKGLANETEIARISETLSYIYSNKNCEPIEDPFVPESYDGHVNTREIMKHIYSDLKHRGINTESAAGHE